MRTTAGVLVPALLATAGFLPASPSACAARARTTGSGATGEVGSVSTVFDDVHSATRVGMASRVCNDVPARRQPTDSERSRHDGGSHVSGDELTDQLYQEHAAPLLRYVLGLTGGDRH